MIFEINIPEPFKDSWLSSPTISAFSISKLRQRSSSEKHTQAEETGHIFFLFNLIYARYSQSRAAGSSRNLKEEHDLYPLYPYLQLHTNRMWQQRWNKYAQFFLRSIPTLTWTLHNMSIPSWFKVSLNMAYIHKYNKPIISTTQDNQIIGYFLSSNIRIAGWHSKQLKCFGQKVLYTYWPSFGQLAQRKFIDSSAVAWQIGTSDHNCSVCQVVF